METKGATQSKINWTGLLIVLSALISDPSFQVHFGDLIPQAWLSKIMFVSGWAVIYFRTFSTTKLVTTNWRKPSE